MIASAYLQVTLCSLMQNEKPDSLSPKRCFLFFSSHSSDAHCISSIIGMGGGGVDSGGWGGHLSQLFFPCCAILRWSHWPICMSSKRLSGVHWVLSAECTLCLFVCFQGGCVVNQKKILDGNIYPHPFFFFLSRASNQSCGTTPDCIKATISSYALLHMRLHTYEDCV